MPCQYSMPGVQDKCQFHVPENEIITLNKQSRCKLHAPVGWKFSSGRTKENLSTEEKEDITEYIHNLIKLSRENETELNLNGVIIPGGVVFDEIEFYKLSIDHAQFLGRVSFDRSSFVGDASFNSTVFKKGSSFDSALFQGKASFPFARFLDVTIFVSAVFEGAANFNASNILGASFLSAYFKNDGLFNGATFSELANFDKIQVDGSIRFVDAQINGQVSFNNAVIAGDANYYLTGVKKSNSNYSIPLASFDNSMFTGDVNFDNRTFTDTTSFRNTVFAKAPSFHNCELHQNTIFESATFSDTSEESSSAYRTLKLQMENVRARREEAMFYALEQQCLRNNKNIPRSVKLFSWLYDVTSTYGQSVGKPLAWLFATFMLFPLIYTSVCDVCCNFKSSFDMTKVGESFALSVQQMVNPFWIWRSTEFPDWASTNLLAIKYIATLQSLVSLAFIALFLLALRWRFKRE